MATQQLADLARSTLASQTAAGATSSTVASGHGSRFPATGDFPITLSPDDDALAEVLMATARTGDVITHPAAANTHPSGAKIKHGITENSLLALIRETSKELAYVEFTAPVSITATTAAAANQVVSAGAVTYDGTPVLLEFFAPYVSVGNDGFCILVLYDSSTEIGRLGQVHVIDASADAAQGGWVVRSARRFTPSAGSHTYIVKAYRLTSDATVHAGAWGSDTLPPGFIRITRA